MLLRQLSYAIKNHLKAPKASYQGLWDEMPPTRGISCLSLVLYGIRMGSEGLDLKSTHWQYRLQVQGSAKLPSSESFIRCFSWLLNILPLVGHSKSQFFSASSWARTALAVRPVMTRLTTCISLVCLLTESCCSAGLTQLSQQQPARPALVQGDTKLPNNNNNNNNNNNDNENYTTMIFSQQGRAER